IPLWEENIKILLSNNWEITKWIHGRRYDHVMIPCHLKIKLKSPNKSHHRTEAMKTWLQLILYHEPRKLYFQQLLHTHQQQDTHKFLSAADIHLLINQTRKNTPPHPLK